MNRLENELRERAITTIKVLREETKNMTQPAITQIVAEYGRDPYLILISCVLSLRTKDTVSLPASRRLFHYAKRPQELLLLKAQEIEKIIYPVGFYRQKAAQLRAISADII